MRKSFYGKKTKGEQTKFFRMNEKIFAPEVIVIDEENKNLGLMPRQKALLEAREKNLDLIEVSPKVNPPICKFMDYGSFKYQREKLERKQKAQQKISEIKTIKISNRISGHDLTFRIEQAVKFLTDRDKVKIEIQLKGRENQHPDLAQENIQKMIGAIKNKLGEKNLIVEQEIKKQGNKLSALVSL